MSAISSSTSGSGLIQYLQGLTNTNKSAGGDTTAPVSKTARHHHNSGFDKLLSAVTSALQSASKDSAADPNQTITDALSKIFQNGSVPATQSNDTDLTPVAKASDAGLPADFVKTLQQFGITPDQFKTDFTNALKSAQQTGSLDAAAAFKSLPTGSIIDTLG